MAEGKTHLSLVICGHVDSGKSTTTGHLLFQLGGINEREVWGWLVSMLRCCCD